GDQDVAGDGRRRGRHVHRARGDRRAPHEHPLPGRLLHHQHGGWRAEEEARPPRGAGDRREGESRPDRRAGAHHRRGGPPGTSRRTQPPAGLAELAAIARTARANAHAPYSRYKVGAALRATTGEIVTGCNIENASYGLTICAERTAVFKAISE